MKVPFYFLLFSVPHPARKKPFEVESSWKRHFTTSPGLVLAPPKNCTFARLIADSKSIRPALSATHLANSLCRLPAFLIQATFSSLATLPTLPFSLLPTLAPSHARLFPGNPPFFISVPLLYLPPIFPPGDALIPSVHTSSQPFLSVNPAFISFSLHFSLRLSHPVVFFCFLPPLLPLISPQMAASVGRMCKWRSPRDCHKTQDIKLSNKE